VLFSNLLSFPPDVDMQRSESCLFVGIAIISSDNWIALAGVNYEQLEAKFDFLDKSISQYCSGQV